MPDSSSSSVNTNLPDVASAWTDHVPVQVTTIQLTKENYSRWSAAITMGIAGRGRIAYVNGRKVEPAEDSLAWDTWFLEDNQVKTWIVNSVSPDIQPLILRKKTPRDMWIILEQMYGQKKRKVHVYQLMKDVYALRQGALSVADFYATLKSKWEDLDYHSDITWRSQILNSDESFSIQDVYSRVEAEEQRRLLSSGRKGEEQSAYVSRAPVGTPRSSRKCTHCKKLGHTRDFCWDLYPEKKDSRVRPSSEKKPVSSATSLSDGKGSISAEQIRELRAYLSKIHVGQADTPDEIRRLKEDVSLQLPPKRRQVIRLILRESSLSTPEVCGSCDLYGPARVPESELIVHPCNSQVNTDAVGRIPSSDVSSYRKKLRQLSYQEIGIAKLPGFREWISNHSIVTEVGDNSCSSNHSQKMIIFGHHLKVLDGIQEIICENHIEFVRIDGCTLPKERQAAVQSFRSRPEVRIAIIVTKGSRGNWEHIATGVSRGAGTLQQIPRENNDARSRGSTRRKGQH
ncbi:hypothetical protein EJ110_NYTH42995 [Nymphaea thermarum]|nr:hypothetical protein EJ110_NYTH42995 [Nymphaea thermarum]